MLRDSDAESDDDRRAQRRSWSADRTERRAAGASRRRCRWRELGRARDSVLLADDQGLVRAGFRALLDAQPDIEVAAEAADGAEAVELARRERPDVVLMDIRASCSRTSTRPTC